MAVWVITALMAAPTTPHLGIKNRLSATLNAIPEKFVQRYVPVLFSIMRMFCQAHARKNGGTIQMRMESIFPDSRNFSP